MGIRGEAEEKYEDDLKKKEEREIEISILRKYQREHPECDIKIDEHKIRHPEEYDEWGSYRGGGWG